MMGVWEVQSIGYKRDYKNVLFNKGNIVNILEQLYMECNL